MAPYLKAAQSLQQQQKQQQQQQQHQVKMEYTKT
jgi:hypothetical protein